MTTTTLWDLGAREYRNRAKQIFFYQRTAAALIELAHGRELSVAVDVGSGSTGLLAKSLLSAHPELRKIYCCDSSPQMILELSEELAPLTSGATQVKCLVASAEGLHATIGEPVDAVFANSAFWLFGLDQSLTSVSRILHTGSSLYFNLSEWDLVFPGHLPHPKYEYIDRELKLEEIPITKSKGSAFKLTLQGLRSAVESHGFDIVKEIQEDIATTRSDWSNFYSISSIAMRSIPNLPHEKASAILLAAIAKMSEDQFRPVRWIHFEVRLTKK